MFSLVLVLVFSNCLKLIHFGFCYFLIKFGKFESFFADAKKNSCSSANVYKEQVCTIYTECVPWVWCGMCLRSTQSLFTTYKQQLCWFDCQLFCNTLVISHLTSFLYFVTYLLYT